MKKALLAATIILFLIAGLIGCTSVPPAPMASEPPAVPPSPTVEPTPEVIPQDQPWYETYAAVLNDWTLIEDYGDVSYLTFYFGDDFSFDYYWLCDVDQNGTPELLLTSTATGITAALTYSDGPVFLDYNSIYGVNKETAELVTHGHWHGAGGTWDNEWTAARVAGDTVDQTVYIDLIDSTISADVKEPHVTISYFYADTFKNVSEPTVEDYDALYAEHVAPCTQIELYQWYERSDLSGLEQIQ